MLKEKHDQWVLETVDCLRQRKARPDFLRICRMVERFHGLTVNETKESLERLTSMGIVLKVYFKGNISYRHVKKTGKGSEAKTSPTNNVYNTSLRIAQAIKSIMKQTGDSASFSDLEAWLISKNPDTRLVKHRLQTALKRETDSKNVSKLSDNTYILTEDLPKDSEHSHDSDRCKKVDHVEEVPKKKADVARPTPSLSSNTASVNSGSDKNREMEECTRRGRPLSKRKKFRKTHGPDFENPLQVKRSYSKDGDKNVVPSCGYCSKTADCNNDGKSEPLLTCKDCDAKAHPSCMDYSEDLARRALNSPWQCMDCKTCCLCDGSENAVSIHASDPDKELMLFCDACDKGYHMTCHEPPLVNKPKGKWICSTCLEEMVSESKVQGQNNQLGKKCTAKSDRLSDGSMEDDDDANKRGKKRKLSRQKSCPEAKRVKTEPCTDEVEQTESTETNNKHTYETYPEGTVGASCFPTPSPSPRPGDTFDYEMKMSQLGYPMSITEDNTTYSDATNWNTDDVVKFFEDCGFTENAQAFKDQEIDGRSLLLMQRNDVLTGLGLKLGPALKIYQKVVRLQIFSQVASL